MSFVFGLVLHISGSKVVEQGVAENGIEDFFFGDVLGRFSDDDRDFPFVIDPPIFGANLDGVLVSDTTGRQFVEQERPGRYFVAEFFGVGGVVSSEADDLARYIGECETFGGWDFGIVFEILGDLLKLVGSGVLGDDGK